MKLNSTLQTLALHPGVAVITKLFGSVEQPGCPPSSPAGLSQLAVSG